ncbi:hypothetical protein DFH08DRAFT_754014 [Mycena albidolilacea]|uniref:Transmembrane protein n=1 Tax=Mycena albidolilacea TaxID=1033008 RepID=A0AAD6ZGE7_9AGAR|nr:hypothetical protein DFH08DRAFT_754014 [Mycena albidolilacea]
MATHTAIVDDRDPLIQYSGSWVPGGAPVEFDSTTMTTVDAGSTATFSFIGTSVTVYATVASKTLEIQPIWSFVVDGTVTGTYTPNNIPPDGVHHQVLWTSSASPLQNGSHTLVITQSQAASGSNKVIFMDYITYTTTSASVESYFIDDRDPQIKYTPAWRQFGSDGDFEHTSQATSSVGDFLTFTFEGKSITFYGGVTSETANASITIDDGPPKFWLPPVGATINNLIFDSGDLSPGNHTLVVTAENDQPVWADYFLVTPNSPGSVNTSSPSSPGSTPASIQKHKSTPIGVIVGPIIGVLALAALAAAAFFFFWRRRRREHELPDRPAPTMSTAHVLDPGHAFGYSGYNAPATAVPPPLLHGYSSHSQVGPLPTPNSHSDSSSTLAAAGVSYSDPSSSHHNPTLPSTGYPSTSHPTHGTPPSSAPNAASSGDYVPPLTPQRRSHKLLREVERSHQLRVPSPSVSGSASISGSTELPPHYTE